MITKLYSKLVDPEVGGEPRAFACNWPPEEMRASERCNQLTRSEAAMIEHLHKVHGHTLQAGLFDGQK